MSSPTEIITDHTSSLCPYCLSTVPARVYRSGMEVFLEKTCPDHGLLRVLVEKDADFYRAAREAARRSGRPSTPDRLVLITTFRCNLNCRLCYIPHRDFSMDYSSASLSELLERVPCKHLSFAGGEPTVMENLPELLGVGRSRGRECLVVTNGLRLADPEYVRELVRSGMNGVILSLNALDPNILKDIDGADVLGAKLRAVENLVSHNIPFYLSFSLVKGVNEQELPKLLNLAIRHYPCSKGFLLENLPTIGRSRSEGSVFLSEIFTMLANWAGRPCEELLTMFSRGAAALNPYLLSSSLGDLLGIPSRNRPTRHPFILRCLSGPNAWNVDLGETPYLSAPLCATQKGTLLPLWEYFIRDHGKSGGQKAELGPPVLHHTNADAGLYETREYCGYAIIPVYNRVDDQLRAELVSFWHDNDAFEAGLNVWQRADEVACVIRARGGEIVGVSSVYVSMLNGSSSYYAYRMFIGKRDRHYGMMSYVTAATRDFLQRLTVPDKPLGMVIVTENTKLMRKGMRRVLLKIGFAAIGTTNTGLDVWRSDFTK